MLLACLDRSPPIFISSLALICILILAACSDSAPPFAPQSPQPAHASGFAYVGPLSMDEMVAYAEVIVHAELESISAGAIRPNDNVVKYYRKYLNRTSPIFVPTLEASFRVIEYMKGSGNSRITVVIPDRMDGPLYTTREEALEHAKKWKSDRSTRWDNRQAMLFLRKAETVNVVLEDWHVYPAGTYRFVGLEGGPLHPDHHSIDNKYTRVWLPSVSPPGGAIGSSDDIYFLTEAPSEVAPALSGASGASGSARRIPSISKKELRSRISEIDAVFRRGAGIEGYDECVLHMYREERIYDSEYGRDVSNPEIDWHFDSGLAAGTVLRSAKGWGAVGSMDIKTSTTGPDSDLFIVGVFNLDVRKSMGDIQIRSTRPIPEGTYRYHRHEQLPWEIPCDYYPEERTTRETVFITAPEGTLHEAFFDPVLDTSSSAVGAVGANGVLKPSAFADSGGATTTATIRSLAWKSGVVKMNVSPHTAINGHILDFIEPDGTVSLSLRAADATVDADNSALSWTAPSQPWEDGDTLMLRIRKELNRAPEFDTSTYAFRVREDAPVGHVIGFVSASDPDEGDSAQYYIAEGNDARKFEIGSSNGRILIREALDYESVSSYTLTLEARDGKENGTATAQITVTNVGE